MTVAPARFALALLASLAVLTGCSSVPGSGGSDAAMQGIDTVVVIFAENHSFDNLYGLFPGADGIANATAEQKTQLDHDGTPLKELIVFGADGKPDDRYPRMPNGPFRIDAPPVSRTDSGSIALTVPYVPTGMNAGVSTVPRGKFRRPRRAAPSVPRVSKRSRLTRPSRPGAPASRRRRRRSGSPP